MVVLIVLCLGVEFLCCSHLMYVFIFFGYVWVTEWPPIGKTSAHSAYYMFSYISTWVQNYKGPLKLKKTLVKVANFSIQKHAFKTNLTHMFLFNYVKDIKFYTPVYFC